MLAAPVTRRESHWEEADPRRTGRSVVITPSWPRQRAVGFVTRRSQPRRERETTFPYGDAGRSAAPLMRAVTVPKGEQLVADVTTSNTGEMKRSLTLTGITVNAMALIAPGAFLWLTFYIQATTGVTGPAMWMGIVVAFAAVPGGHRVVGQFEILST